MKKLVVTSGIYSILALIGGVFFREFTKFFNYVDHTSLSVVHTHLFILGTLLLLLLVVLFKDLNLKESKSFKWFFILYNIALPLFIVTLLTRGILQVNGTSLTSGMNAMISGFAGISHIFLTVSLCFLIPSFKKLILSFNEEK